MYRHSKKSIVYFAVFITVLSVVKPARADTKTRSIKEGNKFYEQGEFEKAAGKYSDALSKDPNSDIINFNLGAAFYKQQDYNAAIDHFQKSLLTDDKELIEKAHYNLGNSLYRLGISKEEDDLPSAIDSLEKALSHYARSLNLNPENEDAKFNHGFVSEELERLKEKLQQQKEEQKQGSMPERKKKDEEQKDEKQGQQQEQENGDLGQKEHKRENAQRQEKPFQKNEKEKKESAPKANQGQGSEKQRAQNQGAQERDTKSMNKKEAQMLLNQYKQKEQPAGLFNPLKANRGYIEVEKDW